MTVRIACFGDSLVQGFPYGTKYSWTETARIPGRIELLNYGLCGDCCDDIFERLRRCCLPEDVRHILFLGGANDALQGTPQEFTMGVLDRAADWCAGKDYRLCIVLPLISADGYLNRRLLNLRQEISFRLRDRAMILDVQPAVGMDAAARKAAYLDGVHPKSEVYEAIGRYAGPLLAGWAGK